MTSLLRDRLQTQKQILANLSRSGRNDGIARIVKTKVAKQIELLQKEIANEERNQVTNAENPLRSAYVAIQAFCRHWAYSDINHYPVSNVSQRQTLQETGGVT